MTPILTNRERIEAALRDEYWIAPCVKEAIVNVEWEKITVEGVDEYLGELMPLATRTVNCMLESSEVIRNLVSGYLREGNFESLLPGNDQHQLHERLLLVETALTKGIDHRHAVQMWHSMLWLWAFALTGEWLESEHARRINVTAGSANLLSLLGEQRKSLDQFSRHVGVDLGTICWTEVGSLLRGSIGRERDINRCTFLCCLAGTFRMCRMHKHSQAVSRYYFDSHFDLTDHTPLFDAVHRLLRYYSDAECDSRGDGDSLAVWRHFTSLAISTLNTLYAVTRTIAATSTDGSGDQCITSDDVLDATFHFSEDQPLDLSHLDLLFRMNQQNESIVIIFAWLDSLASRGHLERLIDSVISECQTGSDELSASWWIRTNSLGRSYLIASILARSTSIGETASAREAFVNGCFAHIVDSWGNLGILLRTQAGDVSAACASFLADAISKHLFHENEHGAVCEFLEHFLELFDPEKGWAYETPELAHRCNVALGSCAFESYVQSAELSCFSTLFFSLANSNRTTRAESLAESLFNVDVLDIRVASLHRLDVLRESAPHVAKGFVGGLLRLCQSTPLGEKLRPLIERILGLPDVVQCEDSELTGALEQFLETSRQPDELLSSVDFLRGLAAAVFSRRGPSLGIRLLECTLGIWKLADDRVSEKYQASRQHECAVWSLIAAVISDFLFHQGVHSRFLTVVKTFCANSDDAEFAWSSVAGFCRNSLDSIPSWMADDTAVAVQQSALEALRQCNRSWEVAEELQCAERRMHLLSLCDHPAPSGLFLSVEVAYLLQETNMREADSLYRNLESRVRGTFGADTAWPYDRFTAARNSGAIRDATSRLGYTLCSKRSRSDQIHIRLECLLLDCRLMNQTFVARWQAGRPRLSIDLDPSLPRMTATDRNMTMEYSRRERFRSNRSDAPAIPLERSSPMEPEVWNQATEHAVTEYDESPDDQIEMTDAVDEAAIANCLQVDEVLLRASFDLDGSMVWTLYRSSGNELHVVGTDDGTSKRRTQRELNEAVARFDSQLSAAWDLHAASMNSSGSAMLGLGQHLLGKALSAKSHRSVSLLARILQEYPRLLAAVRNQYGPPEAWPIATPEWKSWWNEILGRQIVGVPADHSAPRQSTKEESVHTVLDRITAEALREFTRIINVEEIVAQLSTEDRLVVWADDILLSLPWSFLTFQDDRGVETFLFECVKSVRLIVSPLLDKAVRERHIRMEHALPAIVGSLIWLGSIDSARNLNDTADTGDSVINATSEASEAFRNALAEVSTKYSEHIEWWSAEAESGSHEALARGLHHAETQNVAALIVCGHGSDVRSGVVLKDGVWDGSSVWQPPTPDRPHWYVTTGVNLERVDFLIQVSCSIGRPGQQFGDVAGFCTELFLNRGCSVLAGRWLLDSQEGIDFAKAVADVYLAKYTNAVRTGITSWQSSIRSEAVSHVRKEWVKSYRKGVDDPTLQFGLNTIANMDLYGLG